MDEDIIVAAHHEAGHAIMAYLVGWSINSIELIIQNGKLKSGKTNYDFGEDQIDSHVNVFRRVICLVGGPIAQANYESNSQINLDTLGPDGILIDSLFSRFNTYDKELTIETSINVTVGKLNIEANKRAIELIVNSLIYTYSISQIEFLKIINDCNVIRMTFN